MFSLSTRQLQAMNVHVFEQFVARMVAHVQVFFPAQCAALSATDLEHEVRTGIACAMDYDIHAKDEICRFLNLWFLFGAGFDQHPEFVWAQEILSNPFYRTGATRIAMLDAAAEQLLSSEQGLS